MDYFQRRTVAQLFVWLQSDFIFFLEKQKPNSSLIYFSSKKDYSLPPGEQVVVMLETVDLK